MKDARESSLEIPEDSTAPFARWSGHTSESTAPRSDRWSKPARACNAAQRDPERLDDPRFLDELCDLVERYLAG